MSAAARHQVAPHRRAMLAKVHLGAKQLGLDDDARRDLLERITGRRSSADCSDAQLDLVLAEFKRLGWKPVAQPGRSPKADAAPSKAVRRPADSPVALKARALWISLWQLGVVRSSTEVALEAFAKRQLGVESLQWADAGKAFRLIEALKAMATRAGWDQAATPVGKQTELEALKAALVRAQWRRLHELGEVAWSSDSACITYCCRQRVCRMLGGFQWLSEGELDAMTGHLGDWIRRAIATRAPA